MKNINIHPFARVLFISSLIVSTLLSNNIALLSAFYLFFLLPLIIYIGLVKLHFRLLLIGIIPIILTFILLYIIILKEANGGWDFILLKCLKILIFTAGFQVFFSIPNHMLVFTFKKWGIKGDNLMIAVGSFTVWADLKNRANQIITARFARGFIGKRNMLNTAKQFPVILIPLIIGILRTSIERVNVWEQRNIPDLLDSKIMGEVKFNKLFNILIVLIPLAFILASLIDQFYFNN